MLILYHILKTNVYMYLDFRLYFSSYWCTDYIYSWFLYWMKQWGSLIERSPRLQKVGCSNPGRDRPKSLKQIVTAPLLGNACGCNGSSEMTIITKGLWYSHLLLSVWQSNLRMSLPGFNPRSCALETNALTIVSKLWLWTEELNPCQLI